MVRIVRSSIGFVFLVFLPLLLVTAHSPAQDIGAKPGHDSLASDPALNEEAAAVLYRPLETKVLDLDPNTRTIRILVHYGRTEFFVANGKPYGIEYETFSEYEKYLNRNGDKHSSKIGMVFIPVRFEDLIPYLLEGKGDIAAGLLTVTEERKEKAAFTTPYLHDVEEVLVAHSAAPKPKSLDDLSGKTVQVLRGSSFVQHLNTVNR
jgi:ABC-type amino acid transport substrate-binding protein